MTDSPLYLTPSTLSSFRLSSLSRLCCFLSMSFFPQSSSSLPESPGFKESSFNTAHLTPGEALCSVLQACTIYICTIYIKIYTLYFYLHFKCEYVTYVCFTQNKILKSNISQTCLQSFSSALGKLWTFATAEWLIKLCYFLNKKWSSGCIILYISFLPYAFASPPLTQ